MPRLEVSPYVQAQALALADVGIPNSKIEKRTELTSHDTTDSKLS